MSEVTALRYSLLRPELIAAIVPLLASMAAAAAIGFYTARTMTRRTALCVRRPLGDRGTSELELALALPVFLVSVLTTIQLALMINAHLVVDYAAFCAARSAAVWLPQDVGGEGPLVVAPADASGSEKRERIRRAATLAVLPISPPVSRFRAGLSIPSAPQPLDAAALARLASAADSSIAARHHPLRLALFAAEKWPYAYWFTDVALEDGANRAATTFEGATTVTARVTHKFEMAVPFAGQALGYAFGKRYVPFVGDYYVPISSAYTLMMAPS